MGQESGHSIARLTAQGLSHEAPFKVSARDEVSSGSLTGEGSSLQLTFEVVGRIHFLLGC